MVIWDNLFTNKLNKLQFFMSYFFWGTKNVVLKQLLDLLALTAANGGLGEACGAKLASLAFVQTYFIIRIVCSK